MIEKGEALIDLIDKDARSKPTIEINFEQDEVEVTEDEKNTLILKGENNN